MTNYLCVPILDVTNALLSKLYDLLQIMLFCSILLHPDNILIKKPFWIISECQTTPMYHVWKSSIYYFSKYTICCKKCYFAAFCSNKIIFWKEILLNQFRIPKYPCIPILEVINALLSKIYHLLQIMLFCSILQQHDQFWKRVPSE